MVLNCQAPDRGVHSFIKHVSLRVPVVTLACVQVGESGWSGVLAAPPAARARNTGGGPVCNTRAVKASTRRPGAATCSLVKVVLHSNIYNFSVCSIESQNEFYLFVDVMIKINLIQYFN